MEKKKGGGEVNTSERIVDYVLDGPFDLVSGPQLDLWLQLCFHKASNALLLHVPSGEIETEV